MNLWENLERLSVVFQPELFGKQDNLLGQNWIIFWGFVVWDLVIVNIDILRLQGFLNMFENRYSFNTSLDSIRKWLEHKVFCFYVVSFNWQRNFISQLVLVSIFRSCSGVLSANFEIYRLRLTRKIFTRARSKRYL